MSELSALFADPSQSFALIQRQDSEEILVLAGTTARHDRLADIERRSGPPAEGRPVHDSLSVVPFCQVREKGYPAADCGERICTLLVKEEHRLMTEDLLTLLPAEEIRLAGPVRYRGDDEEYEATIAAIIEREIGMGEGANFVIPREGEGRISAFSPSKALTLFKRMLEQDFGTYWKYLYWDPQICFIGSTPERHLEVRDRRVRMNPISGTFRKRSAYECRRHFKEELLRFLRDGKEINELFMVVDEELKMMARMCEKGGAIVGPLLKEMSRLIHTEYLLSGVSDKDVLDLFVDSMFAATVVGSPVENACRIIEKYQPDSRRYYGSALLLLGRDEHGGDFLDSPITIRTLEIDRSGDFHFSVGATLVRDSVPAEEVRETQAKAAAILSCLEEPQPAAACRPMLPSLANDDEIAEELVRRNQHLSRFWFFHQDPGDHGAAIGAGRSITLIHNGDDFLYMLAHMFHALGCRTKVVDWQDYDMALDSGDLTLVGPGPGNPMDDDSRKIAVNRRICRNLLGRQRPSLFICLGHQVLCHELGCRLHRLPTPMQGVQKTVDLFGRRERVGFYNTFVAAAPSSGFNAQVSLLGEGGAIAAIRGSHFTGFQFHPESLLTTNGLDILANALERQLTLLPSASLPGHRGGAAESADVSSAA